jgi:hypothetical protein
MRVVTGLAIVDIDEIGGQFRGYAYMYDSNQGLPNIRADINMRVPGEIISKLSSRCYLCTGCAGNGARRQPLFGVAETASTLERVRVIVTYVEGVPKRMTDGFGLLANEAMAKAWPCKS